MWHYIIILWKKGQLIPGRWRASPSVNHTHCHKRYTIVRVTHTCHMLSLTEAIWLCWWPNTCTRAHTSPEWNLQQSHECETEESRGRWGWLLVGRSAKNGRGYCCRWGTMAKGKGGTRKCECGALLEHYQLLPREVLMRALFIHEFRLQLSHVKLWLYVTNIEITYGLNWPITVCLVFFKLVPGFYCNSINWVFELHSKKAIRWVNHTSGI